VLSFARNPVAGELQGGVNGATALRPCSGAGGWFFFPLSLASNLSRPSLIQRFIEADTLSGGILVKEPLLFPGINPSSLRALWKARFAVWKV